jgi:hypothetical protein
LKPKGRSINDLASQKKYGKFILLGVSEKYKNWWYGYTNRGARQFIVRGEKNG